MKEEWYLVVMTGKIEKGVEYFVLNPEKHCCEIISGPHDWDYVESHVQWAWN